MLSDVYGYLVETQNYLCASNGIKAILSDVCATVGVCVHLEIRIPIWNALYREDPRHYFQSWMQHVVIWVFHGTKYQRVDISITSCYLCMSSEPVMCRYNHSVWIAEISCCRQMARRNHWWQRINNYVLWPCVNSGQLVASELVVVILFPVEYNMIHSIHTTFQQFHKCIPLAVAREALWLIELTTAHNLQKGSFY